MTIKLEVNGIQYNNFESASCEIRLDALSNTFSFDIAAADGVPLPFKGGDPCLVLVNDEVVLTGNIEIITVDYNAHDHTISIQGRDKTGDLLDSTLNPFDISSGITLKELIEAILDQIKLNIDVIDLVNPAPFDATEDIASIESGDNAFSFIEKYARKRQVLLTSDANGNVVINTNSGESALGAVQHIIGSNNNNILSSSFTFDTTGRFNVYKFASQLSIPTLNAAGEISFASTVDQSGETFDPNIRIGRQLVLVSEVPNSDLSNESRAKWEADIRRARGLFYAVTVHGYQVDPTNDDSDLWRINKLYQVIDDFLGKQQKMLCNSVTYTFDLKAGEQTALGFVDEKTYTLDLIKPSTSEIASDILFE